MTGLELQATCKLVAEASEIAINSMGMTFRMGCVLGQRHGAGSSVVFSWQAAPTRRDGGCDWDTGETCWLGDWDCSPAAEVQAILTTLATTVAEAMAAQRSGKDGRVGNVVFWGNLTEAEMTNVVAGRAVRPSSPEVTRG
jgi:hypothetical protein